MLDREELYLDSVSHRYGTKQVLSSVYVNCKIGEIVGLLGRNGSGKSTLLKIAFGSLAPHFSHTKINGSLYDKGYLTGKIAYLPQGPFIPGPLKIKNAIDLLVHSDKETILSLDFIQQHLYQSFDQLSGGIQRLIECFIILYSEASFILLDEPFSQIAPLYIEQIQDHLQLLKKRKGFIITDHYYERILEVSNRVILVHNGCNYQINSREDLALHGYIHSS